MVSQEDKEKLADILQHEASFMEWEYVDYQRDAAMELAQRIINAGWIRETFA